MDPPEVVENMDMANFIDIDDIPAVNVPVVDLSKTPGMNANPQENNTSQQDLYNASDRLQLAMDVDRGRLVPILPPITHIYAGDICTVVGFLPHRNEDPERLDRREYLLPGHEGRVQSTYLSANEILGPPEQNPRLSAKRSAYSLAQCWRSTSVAEATAASTAGQTSQGLLAINTVSVPWRVGPTVMLKPDLHSKARSK